MRKTLSELLYFQQNYTSVTLLCFIAHHGSCGRVLQWYPVVLILICKKSVPKTPEETGFHGENTLLGSEKLSAILREPTDPLPRTEYIEVYDQI